MRLALAIRARRKPSPEQGTCVELISDPDVTVYSFRKAILRFQWDRVFLLSRDCRWPYSNFTDCSTVGTHYYFDVHIKFQSFAMCIHPRRVATSGIFVIGKATGPSIVEQLPSTSQDLSSHSPKLAPSIALRVRSSRRSSFVAPRRVRTDLLSFVDGRRLRTDLLSSCR